MMLPNKLAELFLWEACGDLEAACRRAKCWAECCSTDAILRCRYTAAWAILRNWPRTVGGSAPNLSDQRADQGVSHGK